MQKPLSTDSINQCIISSEHHLMRIDKVLSLLFKDYSRSYFETLFEAKRVWLNGTLAIKRHKVKTGDTLSFDPIEEQPLSLTPQDIPLDILYEDEHIICINKPAGMVVHPAPGHPDHTFVNALLYHCKTLEQEEGSLRPGIVHRLDKETSGVLIAAKSRHAHALLTEQFAMRTVEKEYIALCIGLPRALSAFGFIVRHPNKRQEMTLSSVKGKPAESHFEVLAKDSFISCVKARPKTGRTHQIRVHLKSLGAPILGDHLYSNSSLGEKYGVQRHCLHAHRLKFSHPMTGDTIELEAPIPKDMETIIQTLVAQ